MINGCRKMGLRSQAFIGPFCCLFCMCQWLPRHHRRLHYKLWHWHFRKPPLYRKTSVFDWSVGKTQKKVCVYKQKPISVDDTLQQWLAGFIKGMVHGTLLSWGSARNFKSHERSASVSSVRVGSDWLCRHNFEHNTRTLQHNSVILQFWKPLNCHDNCMLIFSATRM